MLYGEASSVARDGDGRAGHRYVQPDGRGRYGLHPGPFGAGKTVLQHAISKQADADVIIMVACGERANEVVEIFKEFPAGRPAYGPYAHGAYDHHLQHVEHAGCGS